MSSFTPLGSIILLKLGYQNLVTLTLSCPFVNKETKAIQLNRIDLISYYIGGGHRHNSKYLEVRESFI
jgi:hypothetical protein